MTKKGFVSLVLVVAFFALLGVKGRGRAQEESKKAITSIPEDQLVIKVVQMREEKGLVPNTITSSKGTTVIWHNMTSRTLRIRFDRGDQVKMACADPVHFNIQEDGTFQSDEIPFGGTASLCFIEPGEYAYTATGKVGGSLPTTNPTYAHMGSVVIK